MKDSNCQILAICHLPPYLFVRLQEFLFVCLSIEDYIALSVFLTVCPYIGRIVTCVHVCVWVHMHVQAFPGVPVSKHTVHLCVCTCMCMLECVCECMLVCFSSTENRFCSQTAFLQHLRGMLSFQPLSFYFLSLFLACSAGASLRYNGSFQPSSQLQWGNQQ